MNNSSFGVKFFEGNRQRLRTLFTGKAPIVVTANGQMQRSSDSTYLFVQDANFWYLTGIDEPDIILVIDKDKEYLIVPSRSVSRETFEGAISYDELREISGITQIYDEKEGWSQLAGRIKKVKHVATLAVPPAYIDQLGMYTNPARAHLLNKIKDINDSIEPLHITSHLSLMRMIKQPQEIKAIQQAIDITAGAIKKAMTPTKIAKYQNESQIEAELTKHFRISGAKGHAFDPIVANGKNACTVHYNQNNSDLDKKELLLIDIGAEYNHYAADLTRTFSLSTPTKRQQAVYDAVLDVQNYAISLLKPGVLLDDFENDIEHYMGEKLRELGLIKTINHDNVRKYYPYYSSHFLGLNVHDSGLHDRPLEPGVVLTVEPGIHIDHEGIGIRIEDNIVITEDGNTVLSQKLPKRLC
ncbi:M24 family metallopeptidase [bacterium]|jgi:Xaa-Pro aminopeptidase|nr:M24 family metallopeptidase [bacterium]